MRILTIKFPTSNKTYEYLERNPDKVRINYCEKLKLPQSFTEKDTIYKLLTVVDVKDVDVIPSHVTSFIEPVDGNNIIKIGKVKIVPINQQTLIHNKDSNTYTEPKILPIKNTENLNLIFQENISHISILLSNIKKDVLQNMIHTDEILNKLYKRKEGGRYGK